MSAGIYDTNILYVANRFHEATPECIQACTSALNEAQTKIIVIDDNFRILREYQNKISLKDGKGVGTLFLLHILRNRINEKSVELVSIHLSEERGFVEFPADPELETFDLSDRKFVAVAIASKYSPPIFNAVDSDWWKHRAALNRHGIEIDFLCQSEIQAKLARDKK